MKTIENPLLILEFNKNERNDSISTINHGILTSVEQLVLIYLILNLINTINLFVLLFIQIENQTHQSGSINNFHSIIIYFYSLKLEFILMGYWIQAINTYNPGIRLQFKYLAKNKKKNCYYASWAHVCIYQFKQSCTVRA